MKIIKNYLKILNEMEAETISTSISSGNVDPGMESNKSYGFDDKAFMVKAFMVDEDKDIITKITKRIMVDFDGVIHDYKNGWDNGKLGGINPDTSESIKKLKNDGFEIVIFTSRIINSDNELRDKEIEKVSQFLKKHDIPFDKITSEKLPAFAYIDDNAIQFKKDWSDVLEQIKNKINNSH